MSEEEQIRNGITVPTHAIQRRRESFEFAVEPVRYVTASRALPVGTTVGGRYRVEGVIKLGAVACVYRATDGELDREIALKILHGQHFDRSDIRATMEREIRVLRGFEHPNIVRIEGCGFHENVPWLAMQLLRGPTLRDVIMRSREEGRPIAVDDCLALMRPICGALQYAHDRGVIHRDLKPENIVFNAVQAPVLVDFGTSSSHGPGEPGQEVFAELAGTPEYMAPECFCDAGMPEPRSDIYSLALIFYELVAGCHALIGEDERLAAEEIACRQLRGTPRIPAGLSRELWSVLQSGLEKDPELRPKSVAEFLNRLESAHANARGAFVMPLLPAPLKAAKRPWGAAARGVAFGLLFAGFLDAVVSTTRASGTQVLAPISSSNSSAPVPPSATAIAHALPGVVPVQTSRSVLERPKNAPSVSVVPVVEPVYAANELERRGAPTPSDAPLTPGSRRNQEVATNATSLPNQPEPTRAPASRPTVARTPSPETAARVTSPALPPAPRIAAVGTVSGAGAALSIAKRAPTPKNAAWPKRTTSSVDALHSPF